MRDKTPEEYRKFMRNYAKYRQSAWPPDLVIAHPETNTLLRRLWLENASTESLMQENHGITLEDLQAVRNQFPEIPDMITMIPDVWEQLEKAIDKTAAIVEEKSKTIHYGGIKIHVTPYHPEDKIIFWAGGKIIQIITIVKGEDQEDANQT